MDVNVRMTKPASLADQSILWAPLIWLAAGSD